MGVSGRSETDESSDPPIIETQSGDSFEISTVRGEEESVVCEGDGGDFTVGGSDSDAGIRVEQIRRDVIKPDNEIAPKEIE